MDLAKGDLGVSVCGGRFNNLPPRSSATFIYEKSYACIMEMIVTVKMHCYWKNGQIDRGFLFLLFRRYGDNDSSSSSCHISCNWRVIRLETRSPAFNRSLKGHMDKRAA